MYYGCTELQSVLHMKWSNVDLWSTGAAIRVQVVRQPWQKPASKHTFVCVPCFHSANDVKAYPSFEIINPTVPFQYFPALSVK